MDRVGAGIEALVRELRILTSLPAYGGNRLGAGLFAQELLQGLVETLDLARTRMPQVPLGMMN